eukprot:6194667-Pleurochrysis_carterae.AAC.2
MHGMQWARKRASSGTCCGAGGESRRYARVVSRRARDRFLQRPHGARSCPATRPRTEKGADHLVALGLGRGRN